MEISENSSLEEFFNAFVSDEMWAALSYKNAAFVSKGKALKFANGIFEENSDEEFEHMEELVDMAKSLGIVISFNLDDMTSNCTTPYSQINPEEDTKELVKMFIESEKKAIDGYETVLRSKAIKEKPELCQFFGEICNDEHDHLQELEDCYSNISPEDGRISSDDDYEEKNFDDDDDEDIEDDSDKNDGVEPEKNDDYDDSTDDDIEDDADESTNESSDSPRFKVGDKVSYRYNHAQIEPQGTVISVDDKYVTVGSNRNKTSAVYKISDPGLIVTNEDSDGKQSSHWTKCSKCGAKLNMDTDSYRFDEDGRPVCYDCAESDESTVLESFETPSRISMISLYKNVFESARR